MTIEHPPQDTSADTADPAPSAPGVKAFTRRAGGLCAEMISRQRAAAAGMSRAIAQTQQSFAAQYTLGDTVRTQILTQHERTMAEATAQIQALQAAAVVAMQGTREER